MKFFKPLLLIFLVSVIFNESALAQINAKDSSVLVFTYWDKGESHKFRAAKYEFKVNDGDTTQFNTINYTFRLTVLDSTEKDYTILCKYSDFDIYSSDELMAQILTEVSNSLFQEIELKYKISQEGVFLDIINWEDYSNITKTILEKSLSSMLDGMLNKINDKEEKELFKSQFEKTFNSIKEATLKLYSSKEGLIKGGIKDIILMHSFHGKQYNIKDLYEDSIQVSNMFKVDSKISAIDYSTLENLSTEDNEYSVSEYITYDSEQLTQSSFEVVVELAKSIGVAKYKLPTRDDIGMLSLEESINSTYHNTGWLLYSFSDKVTKSTKKAGFEKHEQIEIEFVE